MNSKITFFLTFLFVMLIIQQGCLRKEHLTLHSNEIDIDVLINDQRINWRISPQLNPDRMRIYCNDKNKVTFQTDLDTISFLVDYQDTISFDIVLNSTDTANTEVIGIRNPQNNITNEDKIYWFSKIWSETRYNFVNMDQLSFDLDSLYRTMIFEVLQTKNDYEYYQKLKKFSAVLNDGHTEVSDGGQFYIFSDYIPISLQEFNNRIFITSVRKTADLDSTWVGAELIKIEGIPTYQYIENNIFPYISASTLQHKWMQSVHRIQYDLKSKMFNGTIKKKDGSIQKIVIERNGEATRKLDDEYWGFTRKSSRNIVDLEWKKENIALISFNRFSPEKRAAEEFEKVMNQINSPDGVIIDLRRNGGGSTLIAWHLQKYLTQESSFKNYGWETRINDGVRKANGNWKDEYSDFFRNEAIRYEEPKEVFISDTIKKITCPTIILIGRYTFSSAEDFLVNIFELPNRPLLIGEETGGSTGSPLVISGLPGGGYARICTRRICFPISGKRFVNRGIKPDIEIKCTIEDYIEGKDPVLGKAIEELTKANQLKP